MKRWLFIRGLARESRHWGDFPAQFEKALSSMNGRETHEVICLDAPGNGAFRSASSPLDISKYTDHLLWQWQQNGELGSQPDYLFGISMGGMIALDWMARFGGKAHEGPRGAVIANSSAGGIANPWERIHPLSLLSLLKTEFRKRDFEREEAFLNLVSNSRASKPAKQWATIARTGKTSFQNSLRQIVASERFRLPGQLSKMQGHSLDLLVLGCSQDRLISGDCSPALAKALGAPLEMHPWAGHELTLDDPQWVIERVQSWLTRGSRDP